jgi:hypothetical protein
MSVPASTGQIRSIPGHKRRLNDECTRVVSDLTPFNGRYHGVQRKVHPERRHLIRLGRLMLTYRACCGMTVFTPVGERAGQRDARAALDVLRH